MIIIIVFLFKVHEVNKEGSSNEETLHGSIQINGVH